MENLHLGPHTTMIPARDVRVGQRIAHRNSAGGLVGWFVVERALSEWLAIGCEDGGVLVVDSAADLVEVAS